MKNNSINIEEIINECKNKYYKGDKIRSVVKSNIICIIGDNFEIRKSLAKPEDVVVTNSSWYIYDNLTNQVKHKINGTFTIYSNGKYAEIIERKVYTDLMEFLYED